MSNPTDWLTESCANGADARVDGLISVKGYLKARHPAEEVAVLEKARRYGADAVFFEAPQNDRSATPQAFISRSDGPLSDDGFAELHRQLWSWGGVPLVYRVAGGVVELFRCAHQPDFEQRGEIVCRPFDELKIASKIAADPWWHAERLRNGTL